MSVYRCAVCGSSRVTTETKQEGYNKKKGALGMVMFGLGGAVAGTSGNTVVYYHCATCGHTLNRCMSETTRNLLDQCLLKPIENASMLKVYKKQYPNIEWEDSTINNNLSVNTSRVNINENKLKSEDMSIFRIGRAFVDALYEIAMPCTIAEIQAMNESCRKYSIAQLSFTARCLVKENIIEKITENNETCFGVISPSKEKAYSLLEELRQKEQKAETRSIKISILETLYTSAVPRTIVEMQIANQKLSAQKYSHQRLTFLVRHLVKRNLIKEVFPDKSGKTYFETIPGLSKDKAIKMLGED